MLVIIHDKLLEYGGAESVLKFLIDGLKPKYIITGCINDRSFWEQSLNVKIVTPKILFFVKNQKIYRIVYPLLILILFFIRFNLKNEVALYYSSSLGKHIRTKNHADLFLFSNYPFKGVIKPDEYLSKHSLIRMPVIIASKFLKIFEKLALSRFPKIAVISKDAKLAYEDQMLVSVNQIIHVPVNTSDFEKVDKVTGRINDIKNILIISRLYKEKNVLGLLESLKAVKGVKVTIIGSGPLLTQLRGKYNEYNFKGFVSEHEKLEELSSSDIIINPTAQEWSLTLIEGNCCGVIGISAKCDALFEINECISGCKFLPNHAVDFETIDFGDLISKIPTLKVKHRLRALKYFSKERFIREIEEFMYGK